MATLDPVSAVSSVAVQMPHQAYTVSHGASSRDAQGASLFADMLRSAQDLRPMTGPTPQDGLSASNVLQQVNVAQAGGDPIMSSRVVLDVFVHHMEALSRLHITVALGSSATNVFKQLFNRHD